ncbi:hypothetical protein BLAT2472_40338 [Burkholderia latens]
MATRVTPAGPAAPAVAFGAAAVRHDDSMGFLALAEVVAI